MGRTYIAIDLKSFYASVECRLRGLDPLNTNLVVADSSRTEKTICLAVSPSLKSYGIPGRARLFEVVQKVKEINKERQAKAGIKIFDGKSYVHSEIIKNKYLALDYIVATPQMSKYMEISTGIYEIYKEFVSPDDIVVYSIDEVFIDATDYIKLYGITSHELCKKIISRILEKTGITATAGIGSNLYLCKVAMDIEAKHTKPDKDGVRIAVLDEKSYREKLWEHTPIIDFWRVGAGYQKRLMLLGLYTMGDIAAYSLKNEKILYDVFGINAELLIDHAWGYEPCTIKDIKSYKPENKCISSGQVLSMPYTNKKAQLVIEEMADSLSLDLVSKRLVTNQIVLDIGYDAGNLNSEYKGQIKTDRYGRDIPQNAHGTINFDYTSSTKIIMDLAKELFEKITDKNLLIRRMYVTANHIIDEQKIPLKKDMEQMSFFIDYEEEDKKRQNEDIRLKKERRQQEAVLKIKTKFGKNAILKGMDFEDGATAKERNGQVGGHKA